MAGGIWQGLTSRDAGALKRLGPLLRFFGRTRHFLQSPGWIPHTPMLQSAKADIYASAWPIGNETLWTIVNRGTKDAAGPQIVIEPSDKRSYYDCYHGGPLSTVGGSVSFEVEAVRRSSTEIRCWYYSNCLFVQSIGRVWLRACNTQPHAQH
eukprot:SAG31_NODE_3514_length_4171_cov_6.906925_3_plen_152_part_00